MKNTVADISALIFVSGSPVSTDKLANLADISVEEVEEAIASISKILPDELGFELKEVAGGWRYVTKAACAEVIKRQFPPKVKRLSKAASETLSVIAYKQPVSRSEIESIRGVDALPTLKTLVEMDLVRAVGRQDAPGSPQLYGTTNNFLEKFGLTDLSQLPDIREVEELERTG